MNEIEEIKKEVEQIKELTKFQGTPLSGFYKKLDILLSLISTLEEKVELLEGGMSQFMPEFIDTKRKNGELMAKLEQAEAKVKALSAYFLLKG